MKYSIINFTMKSKHKYVRTWAGSGRVTGSSPDQAKYGKWPIHILSTTEVPLSKSPETALGSHLSL